MRDLRTKCGIIVTEDVMSRWWLRYIISSIGSLMARLQIIIYCMVDWKLHHQQSNWFNLKLFLLILISAKKIDEWHEVEITYLLVTYEQLL